MGTEERLGGVRALKAQALVGELALENKDSFLPVPRRQVQGTRRGWRWKDSGLPVRFSFCLSPVEGEKQAVV